MQINYLVKLNDVNILKAYAAHYKKHRPKDYVRWFKSLLFPAAKNDLVDIVREVDQHSPMAPPLQNELFDLAIENNASQVVLFLISIGASHTASINYYIKVVTQAISVNTQRYLDCINENNPGFIENYYKTNKILLENTDAADRSYYPMGDIELKSLHVIESFLISRKVKINVNSYFER